MSRIDKIVHELYDYDSKVDTDLSRLYNRIDEYSLLITKISSFTNVKDVSKAIEEFHRL
jgi:hypothetical protein